MIVVKIKRLTEARWTSIYNHTALLSSPQRSTSFILFLAVVFPRLYPFIHYLAEVPMADCFSFNISLGEAKHLHSTLQSTGQTQWLFASDATSLTTTIKCQSSQSSNLRPSYDFTVTCHQNSCFIISHFIKQVWGRSTGQHVEKKPQTTSKLTHKMMLLIYKEKQNKTNKKSQSRIREQNVCTGGDTVKNAHVLQGYY